MILNKLVVVPAAPCKVRSPEVVEVPIPTLPAEVTVNIEEPEDEETLNGFNVPLPWMLNETVEEVALTPATVPLSKSMPMPVVVAPVNLVT